jgi:tRNA A-37 threonylcarbamoyl transferase component Bud32
METNGSVTRLIEQPRCDDPGVRDDAASQGATPDAGRNLVFAVIALRNNFIDQADLIAAFHSWAADKAKSLGQVLVARGALTEDEFALVEILVSKHLEKHGGDVRATLGAVADAAARDVLRTVDDADIRESINSLPPAGGDVLDETLIPPTEQHERYTLTRLHAQGGLGRVWLARDTDLNRDVALKEILPTKAAHPEMRRRFLKEAQVTGQLEHPNIVPVYELARRPQDDQPFYTMRFIRGRTLRRAIAEYHGRRAEGRPDPLEQHRLLQAFVGVCQAIGFAHSRGVIHRDLKPDNVVLGDFGEVLVLDWGLAKIVDRADEEGDLASLSITEDAATEATREGQHLGTPAYMAPEQAEGRLDLIDERTDIYGLGAILFEILTGRPPHHKKNIYEAIYNIATGETPRSRSVAPSVPGALDAICAKAMAKVSAERYTKATELVEDLEHWLADEPVGAWREPWLTSAWRWVYRNRTAVTALLSALAVAASWGVYHGRERTYRLAEVAAHRARVEGAVSKALRDADSWRHRAKSAPPGDLSALDEALALVREAGDMLRDEGVEPGLRRRVEKDLAVITEERDGASTEVPGCLASTKRYHIKNVVPPQDVELRTSIDGGVPWEIPDYSGFTILRMSNYIDLTDWKPIPPGTTPATAGRIQPAYNTCVVDLIRKVKVSKDNSRIRFQSRTEGAEIDKSCLGRNYKVWGTIGREALGGGTRPVLVREIEIDLSDIIPGNITRIVCNDTSWNGFQYHERGTQWVATLALDDLSEAELAIKFPHGLKPKNSPRLFFYEKGKEYKEQPLDAQNFTNPSDQDWWMWQLNDIKKNHIYQMEWDWIHK